jgi:hypothetical protein
VTVPPSARGCQRQTHSRLHPVSSHGRRSAAYLNRGERTVRRWEQTEGLPTHRHVHNERATVYAFKSEIDAWWQNRGTVLEDPTSDDQLRWAGLLRLLRPRWIVALVIAGLAGCVLWLYMREQRETGASVLKVRPPAWCRAEAR